MKTPLAVLSGSLNTIIRKVSALSEETWQPAVERIKRNLDRLLEIQYEVDDIMTGKEQKAYGLLSLLLEECTDELTTLVAVGNRRGTIGRKN